jgi:trimethylamine:corrinoid methyltransferase-like protein
LADSGSRVAARTKIVATRQYALNMSAVLSDQTQRHGTDVFFGQWHFNVGIRAGGMTCRGEVAKAEIKAATDAGK